jgi:exonuclease SbcC
MRPIKLHLEGFTSFKQSTVIDFSQLDIFLITGPTGSGKTSIIDAIIYALYGCTPRLGKQSISALISQGASNLRVYLEFSSGKSKFRVVRHSKRINKRTLTEVRFEEFIGDEWKSRADKIGQVDPIIEEVVGLDFKGFTKSVVLPQGRFDEFLKGKIVERREILSDLLQLDVYRRMMERANEIAKDNKSQADNFANLLSGEYVNATHQNLTHIEQQLAKLKPALDPLNLKLQHITELMPVAYQLRKAISENATADIELKQLAPEKNKADKTLTTAQQQLQSSTNKLEQIEVRIKSNTFNSVVRDELLAKINKCEQLQLNRDRAREIRKLLTEKSREFAELEARYKTTEANLNAVRQQRKANESRLNSEKSKRDEMWAKHGSPDAVKAAVDINKRRLGDLKTKSNLETDVTRLKETQTGRVAKINELDTKLAKARNELANAKHDLEVLNQEHQAEELRQLLEEGKPCPVCEQTVEHVPATQQHVNIEQQAILVERYDQEVHLLSTTKSATEGGLEELVPQVESKQREINEISRLIDEADDRIRSVLQKDPGSAIETELKELRREMQALERQLENIVHETDESRAAESRAKESLSKVDRELIEVRSTMSASAAELARLDSLIEGLTTALGKDDDLSLLNAELSKQDAAKRELETDNELKEREARNQSRAKDAVNEATRTLERLTVQMDSLEKTQTRLRSDVQLCRESLTSAFPDLDIDASEPDAAAQLLHGANKLQAEADNIQRKILEHEQRIKILQDQIERAAEIRTKMEFHRRESAVAYELAQALRADQFIDFIQREAYHRLAVDGSRHMRTLSSERYTFGFDKNEFVVRDHWNADEERPVTTLSGGESFLASLALAWALADGLSGLSHGRGRFALESLFLDEGFGTLDSETLDAVLQGVEKLSSTNRLVGIISHIPELADRMPSRIYVRKAVGGSTVDDQ